MRSTRATAFLRQARSSARTCTSVASTPGQAGSGAVWRSAMIDPPFFPVATPDAFYALLQASGSKEPDAMKNFAAAHPEIAAFGAWAGSAPWTASYAEDTFNGLNAFLFVDAAGTKHAVRWSLKPQAEVKGMSGEDFAKLGPDHLAAEITARVAAAPQRWTMTVTVADASDPTADPSTDSGPTPHVETPASTTHTT